MKKTSIFLVFSVILSFTSAAQQYDTLRVGEREPTFYYWDTNWFDHYAGKDYRFSWGTGSVGSGCRAEVARYCWTDSSLRVIGVAAAINFTVYKSDPHYYNYEDPWKNFETEYLRLYEVDSVTGEMVQLASGSWTYTDPHRYFIKHYWDTDYYYQFTLACKPVYEVYFDSAITVYDSFYVAATENNNHTGQVYLRDNYVNVGVVTTMALSPTGQWLDNPPKPNPNHYRIRLHETDCHDSYLCLFDTNWHVISKYYCPSWHPDPSPDFNEFLFLFPIIDTSRYGTWMPDCEPSSGLTTTYVSGEVAVLTWNGGGNASSWELSLCAGGCAPDSGTVSQWGSEVATVTGLDTATWYTAWVRSVCGSDRVSEWSDSIRFYVPGSQQGTESIESPEDRYAYLMPNPASESVTVASSFRIRSVEVYSLTGRLLVHKDVDALSATLDISSLPSGTYMVHISTPHGSFNKKLVVKR